METVLVALAPSHYALIPKEATQPLPRAFEYYLYFNGLGTQTSGWKQIVRLADARRGDILAWELPLVKGQDTGHVVFLGDTPVEIEDGVWSVRVYDSADKPHFEDTRADGTSGVGSGFIRFQVDAEGRATGLYFLRRLRCLRRGRLRLGGRRRWGRGGWGDGLVGRVSQTRLPRHLTNLPILTARSRNHRGASGYYSPSSMPGMHPGGS